MNMTLLRFAPTPLLLSLVLGACGSSGGGGGSTPVGPSEVAFNDPAFIFLLGVPVPAGSAAPSVAGTVDSWSIDPALPAGLAFSTSTGAVSGTPSAAADPIDYTVTANGLGESASTTITIGVARPAQQSLVASSDGTISTYVTDPVDGTLTFQSSVGLSVNDLVSLTAAPAAPVLYALALDGMGGMPSISTLTVTASGEIGLADELALPAGSSELGATQDGSVLVVASASTGEVSSFAVDPVSGIPSSAGPSLMPVTDVSAIAVDPLGRFAWVTSRNSSELVILDIDPDTGALSQSLAAQDLNSSTPSSLAVSPDGQNLYLGVDNFDFVTVFDIDADTGALTTVTSPLLDLDPSLMVMHPRGLSLVIADATSGMLTVLSRDEATGALGAASAEQEVGPAPSIRFDESGLLLIAASSGTLSSFEVDPSDGQATLGSTIVGPADVVGFAVTAGDAPIELSVRALYVVNNEDANVTVYGPDSDGNLVERGMAIPTGVDPVAIDSNRTGSMLAVANSGDNSITLIQLDPAGDPMATAAFTPAGAEPTAVLFSRNGNQLFVARASEADLAVYSVDESNLTLTLTDTSTVGGRPEHMALSADERFLAVVDTSSNRLITVDVSDGTFDADAMTVAVAGTPSRPTFLGDGRTVLVPIANQPEVQTFRLDPDTGNPVADGPPAGIATSLEAIALHPNGNFAYGASSQGGQGAVETFDLDAAAGTLASRGETVAGTGPQALVVGPSGQNLFVASGLDDSLNILTIGSNGGLSGLQSLASDGGPIAIELIVDFQ